MALFEHRVWECKEELPHAHGRLESVALGLAAELILIGKADLPGNAMADGKEGWVVPQLHLPPAQARIRGTELTVGQVLERLSPCMSETEIARAFPELPAAGAVLEEVLQYASRGLSVVSSPEPDKKLKDCWDKAAVWWPSSATVVLALVGVCFTHYYNSNSQKIQRVQTFSQFMPYLTGKDESSKEYAMSALARLGDIELAVLAAGTSPSLGTFNALMKLASDKSIKEADRKSASEAFIRIFGDDINKGFLGSGEYELDCYGFYTYLLFASKPNSESRERYVQALDIFLRTPSDPNESLMARQSSEASIGAFPTGPSGPTALEMTRTLRLRLESGSVGDPFGTSGPEISTLKGQLVQLSKTYVPVKVVESGMSADRLLDIYDYDFAQRLLKLFKVPHATGPYVVGYSSPLGRGTEVSGPHLCKDLSSVSPQEVKLWMSKFFRQISGVRTWDTAAIWKLSAYLGAVNP